MADETKLTAATRLEKLLDNIAGGDNDVTPATRLEKFLSYIADAMEGGGGSGGGGDGCECGLFTVTIKTIGEDPYYTFDMTFSEIESLLSEGKRPIAFIEDIGGSVGIVSSNQYVYIPDTVIGFTFEYSYQASVGADLTFVNRQVYIGPDGSIGDNIVTGRIGTTV